MMSLREEEKPNSNNKTRWKKHYSSDHRILLVGDGDFSFSLCLGLAFGDASNILATSFDSYDVVIKKYKGAKANMLMLQSLGAELLHEVDAIQMKLHKDLQNQKFDRIIFNFPHAGFLGLEDDQQVIMIHRILVSGFLKNASGMLHPKGEVHVTHKTSDPFHLWNIEELATQNSLTLLERVKFRLKDYPGYHNKRGDGDRPDSSFPLRECSTYKFVSFSEGAMVGSSAGGNKASKQLQQPKKHRFSPQKYHKRVTQRPFGSVYAGSGVLGSAPQTPINLFGQELQYHPSATYGSTRQLPFASVAQGQQSQPNSWTSYTHYPTLFYGEQVATSIDLASMFSCMYLQPPEGDLIYGISHMT